MRYYRRSNDHQLRLMRNEDDVLNINQNHCFSRDQECMLFGSKKGEFSLI